MTPGARCAKFLRMKVLRSNETMHANKLVSMLNQIATFHRRQSPETAAAEIAEHVQRFWEPRMRAAIYAHLDAGGEGMAESAKLAVAQLKARDEGKTPFDPTEAATLGEPLEA